MEIGVIAFGIFEIILFSFLIICSKFFNLSKNYIVWFRTKTSLTNEETFEFANNLFNNYNSELSKILLFLTICCFIISVVYINYFYIIYLPIIIFIIAYFILAFKIDKIKKKKFNIKLNWY